jgi:hypothetical protein
MADTCVKCSMPLDAEHKCSCSEDLCCYCCECGPDCPCGCADKKAAQKAGKKED